VLANVEDVVLDEERDFSWESLLNDVDDDESEIDSVSDRKKQDIAARISSNTRKQQKKGIV
jgi:hypothetical protein